jgi:hypothetical protein
LVLLSLVIGLTSHALVPSGSSGAYREVEVAGGGTIRGNVTFTGPLPDHSVEQIPLAGMPEVCGTGSREVRWVNVEDGALRGVFVFLDGIQEGKKWSEPQASDSVIDHKGCRITPWAQVVRFGPITVRNSDGIAHHVDGKELIGLERDRVTRRTSINHGLPEAGEAELDLVNRRSPSYVFITCEEHRFEFGYLMAFEHPYAAVVDGKGEFVFDRVPEGTHTVMSWHPRLGFRTVNVTVAEDATAEAAIEYSQ